MRSGSNIAPVGMVVKFLATTSCNAATRCTQLSSIFLPLPWAMHLNCAKTPSDHSSCHPVLMAPLGSLGFESHMPVLAGLTCGRILQVPSVIRTWETHSSHPFNSWLSLSELVCIPHSPIHPSIPPYTLSAHTQYLASYQGNPGSLFPPIWTPSHSHHPLVLTLTFLP